MLRREVREGDRVKVPSNLLAVLRQRDLQSVAKSVAAETGMVYRPFVDGERTAGVYRRLVATAAAAWRCWMMAWASAWCPGVRSLSSVLASR